jgi:hypothetical protein
VELYAVFVNFKITVFCSPQLENDFIELNRSLFYLDHYFRLLTVNLLLSTLLTSSSDFKFSEKIMNL